MQIQKEEIRKGILEAATDEFYSKGYRNASLRRIAAGAGITVGNIYRYYHGKEALYEAVTKPAWDGMKALFEKSLWQDGEIGSETLAELAKDIGGIFIENQKQFLILIKDEDGGSKTEAKNVIIELIKKQARINIEELEPGKNIDEVLLSILAAAVTEAMICVFTSFDGDQEMFYSRIFKVTQHIFGNIKNILFEEAPPC